MYNNYDYLLGECEDMAKTTETENGNAAEEIPETKEGGEEQSTAVDEEQKLPYEVEDSHQTCIEDQSKETESNDKNTESKASETAGDDENKCILSKLFVHSQWLSVQSPYFKALFYSGMKETYSNKCQYIYYSMRQFTRPYSQGHQTQKNT
jgi:archaellum component FlaD/FlaE